MDQASSGGSAAARGSANGATNGLGGSSAARGFGGGGTANGLGGGGTAGSGASPPGCVIRGQIAAAFITVPLLPSANGTPDGVFTACQSDACVSGLVAGVESVSPYRVLINLSATSLSMSWLDTKFGGGPDIYRVTFSPAGNGKTLPVFSTLVQYGLLALAPDTSGVGCPSVALQAQVELTEPVDLAVGSGGDAGAAGAANDAGASGAGGAAF